MEPDSSSPASICLTVPPIFPFIPSLPLVPPSQFLIRCVVPWLWPSFILRSSGSFALPVFARRSLRALGLSGSCQGNRRAHWCRRHRWGRPGQPVCSAPPRDGTLRSESCHIAATAEPARKTTHTRRLNITWLHFKICFLSVLTKQVFTPSWSWANSEIPLLSW